MGSCWSMDMKFQLHEVKAQRSALQRCVVPIRGGQPLHFGITQFKFSSLQSLSHVRLFATPWTAAHQASLSITISLSFLKVMSIELVMPSNHLTLCRSHLLPPSIFPSIRVFCIRWPKYRSFSFNISPSNKYSGLISFRI